jgi:hypothetical protein
MRYRKLTPTGDFRFGQQQADYWIDQPEAVAQAVTTRLRLQLGEWFLDTTDGTDWRGKVLGNRTVQTRDTVIRSRVLLTPGVNTLNDYSSSAEPNSRAFSAQMTLDTIFGKFTAVPQQYQTPPGLPTAQPPPRPVGVVVTVLDENDVQINWTPYHV